MQLSVRVAQAEHQGRLRSVAGDADHGAVGRALPLHLDPFAVPGQIPPVIAFGHQAFQAGHQCQPLLGFVDGGRLSDELDDRVAGSKHRLEAMSSITNATSLFVSTLWNLRLVGRL